MLWFHASFWACPRGRVKQLTSPRQLQGLWIQKQALVGWTGRYCRLDTFLVSCLKVLTYLSW